MYNIAGYAHVPDHPDIVTGIILEDKENPSVKLKMSVDKAREMYLNKEIEDPNIPKS